MIKTAPIQISITAQSVLKVLIYFDLFDYPLRLDEIVRYLDLPVKSEEKISIALDELLQASLVYKTGLFYTLRPEENLGELRLTRNQLAQEFLGKAVKMTRIISRFPFVKMVSISGSLSKDCAYPDSDIDYFIITQSGRVWLTRFLLTLYKKTILLNNPKYFCTNLIMGHQHLFFEYQSHYTAMEIASVLPLMGGHTYGEFWKANSWIKEFFPNATPRNSGIIWPNFEKPWYSRWLEKLLDNILGNLLDNGWKNIVRWKWAKDHKHQKEVMQNGYDYIDIQPHIVKGHGGDQHPRIRKQYAQALENFGKKHQITW